jgi:predicted nucleic acid-binding protein
MRVYFDSVTMIYFVEQVSPWFSRIQARLTATATDIAISDLTRMECLVGPLQRGDTVTVGTYLTAFSGVELAPLTGKVFDRAAEIRARYRFKTPDAIHLAAATEGACDVFWTNDQRLSAFTGIPVQVI